MGVHMYTRYFFAKQSKLVGIIHAYTLVIRFRSEYEYYVRVWTHGFAQQEGEGVLTNYVKVCSHGFARQEGKIKRRAYLVVLGGGEESAGELWRPDGENKDNGDYE